MDLVVSQESPSVMYQKKTALDKCVRNILCAQRQGIPLNLVVSCFGAMENLSFQWMTSFERDLRS